MIDLISKNYEEEVKKIVNDVKNIAVFLVGSSKNFSLKKDNIFINDIDLFVISNQREKQIREIKKIDNIEIDINYFSYQYINELIKEKEYFFINEMKDAKVVYDMQNISENIIFKCRQIYNQGPSVNNDNKKIYISSIEIYENISRLRNKEKYEKYEYEFLTNLYIKDIINEYFNIKNKWIPKNKKIFKYLNENEKELLKLIQCVYEKYDYESLEQVYKFVFGNIDQKNYIKITY